MISLLCRPTKAWGYFEVVERVKVVFVRYIDINGVKWM